MSIIEKLTVNLAITILFVIGAAIATIVMSLSYERRLEAMYRDHLLGTVALASAMDELWKLRYGFPQFMVLGVDERRRIVAEEPQRYAAIERHLKDYSSTRRSPEERESLERLLAYLIRVMRINVLYNPPCRKERHSFAATGDEDVSYRLSMIMVRSLSDLKHRSEKDPGVENLRAIRNQLQICCGALSTLIIAFVRMRIFPNRGDNDHESPPAISC